MQSVTRTSVPTSEKFFSESEKKYPRRKKSTLIFTIGGWGDQVEIEVDVTHVS